MICPHCKSEETVKMGYYFTKRGERRQRYKCKVCGRTFVLNPIIGIILKNLRRWWLGLL